MFPGGRCTVCVIQRKGKCGTDSAPKKCLKRGPDGSAPPQEEELLWQNVDPVLPGAGAITASGDTMEAEGDVDQEQEGRRPGDDQDEPE